MTILCELNLMGLELFNFSFQTYATVIVKKLLMVHGVPSRLTPQ